MAEKKEPDNKPESGNGGKRPRGLPFLFITVFLLLGLLVMVGVLDMGGSTDELSSSELRAKLEANEVKELEVNIAANDGVYEVTGKYNAKPKGESETFRAKISSEEWKQWQEQYNKDPKNSLLTGVQYSANKDENTLKWFLINILPIVLIAALIWFFFFRRGGGPLGGGMMNFGKSRAKMFSKEDVTITFDDVAGAEEAKEEVSEVVEFLRNPKRFTRLGAKIPKGLLMIGPPGCGKTLLAKAIAGEAERPFFSISGSDFVEMFVGVGASRVRDLFRTARDNAPCIVFVDEIDAVGRRRGTGVGGGHDEREQTLNALLVEMDGIGSSEGVILLAATNRADVLDNALLRPGRFDRQVYVDMPDLKGREAILKVHLKNVEVGPDVDPAEIAKLTPGFSGADLMNLVNEAALIAVIQNFDYVTRKCITEARDRVRFGREKKARMMDDEERRLTAYHEAGHALIQELTENTDKVHKVTIIPRGQALGATMSLPDKDRHSLAQNRAEETLMVLYGGRAAEEIMLNEVSAGAASDIQQATRLARKMVTEWGMSKRLGLLNYAGEDDQIYGQGMIRRETSMSEDTANAIDAEMRRLVDEAWDKTCAMLRENEDKLTAIAEALLKYETLEGEEVRMLINGDDIDNKREKEEEDRKAEEAARKHRQMEERASERKQSGDAKGFSEQPGTA